jgi:hypothetical protein
MWAREGQIIDITEWCHYWVYDVASNYTFGRSFGFLDQGSDIRQMIKGADAGFQYATLIGQIPFLHPWLLGNHTIMRFMRSLPLDLPDPATEILKVRASHPPKIRY